MIDPDAGWLPQRLTLEPLQPGNAAELFPVLDAVLNPDTPLPPEEPTGENPPDGAIVDFYLRDAATGAPS